MKIIFLMLMVRVAMTTTELPVGYHAMVGIPAAKHIYKLETTAAPDEARDDSAGFLTTHPFLVGVVVDVSYSFSVCGSSLLSGTHAVTAAHCWWDGVRKAERFTLVFGSEFIFVGGTRVETDDVTMHPGWDPEFFLDDLAIIKFDKVTFNELIQPIALPIGLENYVFDGYLVQSSGYGKLAANAPHLNQVQTDITLQLFSTKDCMKRTDPIIEKILCAFDNSPQALCISDSGGPLSIVMNNRRVLLGVSFFGDYECANPQNQSRITGYVRVAFYLRWIQDIMDRNEITYRRAYPATSSRRRRRLFTTTAASNFHLSIHGGK